MSEHTPTPWGLIPCSNGGNIVTRGTYGQHQQSHVQIVPTEDAAFIVRACNAHDSLVAALDELLTHIEWTRSRKGQAAGPQDCTHRAKAALALARGKVVPNAR